MRRLTRASVRKMAVTEIYYVAYALCSLIENMESLPEESEVLKTLVYKMAFGLQKTEEFDQLIENAVCRLMKEGKLTPVNPNEASEMPKKNVRHPHSSLADYIDDKPSSNGYMYTHHFDYDGDLKYSFREDEKISRAFRSWETETENDVNFCRMLFIGGRTVFCDLLKTAFLSDGHGAKISSRIKKLATSLKPVAFLQEALSLSDNEARLLLLAYKTRSIKELWCITSAMLDEYTWFDIYGYFLNFSPREVQKMLRLDGKLVSYGFMDSSGEIDEDSLSCIANGTLETFFSDIVKEQDTADAFSLESFSVNEKAIGICKAMLSGESAVNILLYGAPGSGKTEFAKSLAKQCGLKAFVFKNDAELDNEKGINSICRLNCFLSLNKSDSVIIVDEADTILETQLSLLSFLMNSGNSSPKKGTVNRMLENSLNKVIWIVNHTSQIETSTRRRFTYSIKFNEMTETALKEIAGEKIANLKMADETREKILELCGRYRVTGASVDNMVKTLKSLDLSDNEKAIDEVQEVLEANSTLLFGKAKMRERVGTEYNVDVLNCSVSAEKIVKMVKNAIAFAEKNRGTQSGIRILLYGASGTGKTEFARYIASEIHKKILLRRASDVLGKYVGESEKNIRAAFEEAEQTGSILLFDEADSFFADREGAKQSWERTLTNEFLTQMEEFSGILICTTNLRSIMDTAALRRFHITSEFKCLSENGVNTLLQRFFPSFVFDETAAKTICRYDTATPGDFGTLMSKLRFMDKNEVTAEYIFSELCKIQEEKYAGKSKKIGF